MNTSDLLPFADAPFLFWFKDEGGVYRWGNSEIQKLAKESIEGKMDRELPWAENAEDLRAHDRVAKETGKAQFIHEYVDDETKGRITLNVCKWPGDLDGQKGTFGISFRIGDE
jgi:hypothetical protein